MTLRPRDWAIAALIVVSLSVLAVLADSYWLPRRVAVPVRADTLQVGDCIQRKYDGVLPEFVPRVRCDGPHYGEVFAILPVRETQTYPGDEALTRLGHDCGRKFIDYAPELQDGPRFHTAVGYPRAAAWANGSRSVVCAAVSEGERWQPIAH